MASLAAAAVVPWRVACSQFSWTTELFLPNWTSYFPILDIIFFLNYYFFFCLPAESAPSAALQ